MKPHFFLCPKNKNTVLIFLLYIWQCTVTHLERQRAWKEAFERPKTTSNSNTQLQHTATRCNIKLQHTTATHGNTLQHQTATHNCNTRQHTATHLERSRAFEEAFSTHVVKGWAALRRAHPLLTYSVRQFVRFSDRVGGTCVIELDCAQRKCMIGMCIVQLECV